MTSVQKWKPGDVAMIPSGPVTFFAKSPDGATYWTNAYGYQHPVSSLTPEARPLVVIDPDRGHSANRLMHLMGTRFTGTMSDLRDILREFASPTPRIEEPTAVGARVVDNDGEMWVRHVRGEWACLHSSPGKDVRTWPELCAQYAPLTEVPA